MKKTLQEYNLIQLIHEGEEVINTFVATRDEEALEIAKVLYYVRNYDHWQNVEEDDGYAYTLENLEFDEEWENDECWFACDYVVRKVVR